MHFVIQTPSLQHLAGIKIVATLWNQGDIMSQIIIVQSRKSALSNDFEEEAIKWKEIEEKVKSKAWALPLPEQCKKQLISFIPPLGREINYWCQYHSGEQYRFLGNFLPQHFCWTMHGTIDYSKMAELMVNDERLDVESRYEIACLNCLEDEARQLIPDLSEDRRQRYIHEEARYLYYHKMDHRILIAYFTSVFSGDVDHLNRLYESSDVRSGSVIQYLFTVVLCDGSRATCEYFLTKLSQREAKKKHLLRRGEMLILRHSWSPTCSLTFYLSLLNEEHWRRDCVFHRILLSWLRWPMQSLFVAAVECGWQLLNDSGCFIVLIAILDHISAGYNDSDYSQLFWKCWRLTPDKQNYLNHYMFLHGLLESKQEEFILLFLNEASADGILHFSHRFHRMDRSVISDTALMECKATAALNSSNDSQDEEKRLRSQHLSQLIDSVIEGKNELREEICKGNGVFFV